MVKALLARSWRAFCLMLGNQPSLTGYLLPLMQWLKPGFLPGQYRAQLVASAWQTADMIELTLQLSKRWPGFVPGQHINVTLNHNGRYLTRPFSICSSFTQWQSQGQISLCCKLNREGEFTPLLARLTKGQWLSVSAAQGEFVWQQPALSTVFIAAGSGITPVAAMLLSQRHWLSAVTLHYRVRGNENAALLAPLQQLAQRNPLFNLQLSDSRVETATEFSARLMQQPLQREFYLCGPARFMQQVTTNLTAQGVSTSQIHCEQFAPLLQNAAHSSTDDEINSTFIVAGLPKQIALPRMHSLLQSAEQQGLGPAFGCRMGVCFQCVCEKVSGQVRDMRNGLLSGHGREQIQLCISQPVTELVIKL